MLDLALTEFCEWWAPLVMQKRAKAGGDTTIADVHAHLKADIPNSRMSPLFASTEVLTPISGQRKGGEVKA